MYEPNIHPVSTTRLLNSAIDASFKGLNKVSDSTHLEAGGVALGTHVLCPKPPYIYPSCVKLMLGIIVFLGHTANIVLPFGLFILFIFKVQRYGFHVADYSHWWEVRVSLRIYAVENPVST